MKQRPGLLLVLGLTSLVNLLFLAFRIWQSETYVHFSPTHEGIIKVTYLFLTWNLLLAWIPYGLSILALRVAGSDHRGWLTTGVLLVWLLFFPNAPYIITDLLHLRPRPPIPYWYDGILLFSFAWTGLMLGYASLINVERITGKLLGFKAVRFISVFVLLLSSFGISLGRFQRWNSWDIFYQPAAILTDVMGQLQQPEAHFNQLGLTLIMGGLLISGYFVLLAFRTR